MSTLYNRRRGAKANRPRRPRKCDHLVQDARGFVQQCIQLAPRNRYCEEHQVTRRAA